MKISPSESLIMDILWRSPRPLMSDEVALQLADEQNWSRGTVRTFLTRLVKKKAVAAEMVDRRYLYRPLIDRAAYAAAESRSLLDRLFDGQILPFVTQFAGRKDLTSEELAELRRVIERLQNDR